MRRTRSVDMGVADAILVSDLHLTESTPVSRTDDYVAAQMKKLAFIKELSERHNHCPVLCAGDVFDHWKASPWLLAMAYTYLPRPFVTVAGQHDLPMHSLEEYNRSGLSLLETVCEEQKRNSFTVLRAGDQVTVNGLNVLGYSFGTLGARHSYEQPQRGRSVVILHELTWLRSRPPWAKGTGHVSRDLIGQFEGAFDLILTGDNHESFFAREDHTCLVNPGSMMRINADQADHKPRCFLYYAQRNQVKMVDLPIEKDVHDRTHLDRVKARDERIAAYIERMSDGWEIGLSFRKNLEAYFEENSTPKKVREIIWQHFEAQTT